MVAKWSICSPIASDQFKYVTLDHSPLCGFRWGSTAKQWLCEHNNMISEQRGDSHWSIVDIALGLMNGYV